MSLTRSGYICTKDPGVVKELTVRPDIKSEFGFTPPSFKVYRPGKHGTMCVPRYYGIEKFGEPLEDKRPDPCDAPRSSRQASDQQQPWALSVSWA